MINTQPILFIAVHYGPYLTLRPVAEAVGSHACYLLGGPALAAHHAAGLTFWDWPGSKVCRETFERFLLDHNIQAMIVGTSENLFEDNIETVAQQAANRTRIPVFVIEDFPGNYRHRPGSKLDGLFVEDGSMVEVHVRQGVGADRIHCMGNPRYDGLRTLHRRALRESVRTRLNAGIAKVILWAGQPDEAFSHEAFARLVPALLESGGLLWFKAHPRDQRYRCGDYRRWLDRESAIVDVTSEKDVAGLCCAADLVVTQFSSVGGEAEYLGTPALYALFYDLGRAYLEQHKGYSTVPWATNGSAFLLRSGDDAGQAVRQALHDERARTRVMRNFHAQFGVRPPSAAAIAAHVRDQVQGASNKGGS